MTHYKGFSFLSPFRARDSCFAWCWLGALVVSCGSNSMDVPLLYPLCYTPQKCAFYTLGIGFYYFPEHWFFHFTCSSLFMCVVWFCSANWLIDTPVLCRYCTRCVSYVWCVRFAIFCKNKNEKNYFISFASWSLLSNGIDVSSDI